MSKIVLLFYVCFMCVIVGLTTVDKLEDFYIDLTVLPVEYLTVN